MRHRQQTPKLLLSVRDAEEARDAILGGADWIDLKEPSAGALGAVSAAVAKAAVDVIGNRCLVSAALGELDNWQPSCELLTIPQIRVLKLGLAQCRLLADWQSRWHAAFETCSRLGKHLAAVVYADWSRAAAPHPEAILECASRAGAKYLLIDTFEKQGVSSLEIYGRKQLGLLLELAQQRGLTTVLAGSLRVNDLPRLADLPVDIIAVRGAACSGGRNSVLDPAKVRSFRERLEFLTGNAKELNPYLTTRR